MHIITDLQNKETQQ